MNYYVLLHEFVHYAAILIGFILDALVIHIVVWKIKSGVAEVYRHLLVWNVCIDVIYAMSAVIFNPVSNLQKTIICISYISVAEDINFAIFYFKRGA